MIQKQRIEKALDIVNQYGGIDGAHHKQWVLDQVVRALTGDGYEQWVERHIGKGDYDWDVGIAP